MSLTEEIEFAFDPHTASKSGRFRLRPTELEMLRFLAEGKRQKEIARHYRKAQSWVSNAFDRIRVKMNARTSYHMLVIAYKEGLLE